MARSPDLQQNRSLVETVKDMRRPQTITDTGWVNIGTATTVDPISPQWIGTWGNATGNGPPLRFHLTPDGYVELEGNIDGGAVGDEICILPEDFRPEYSQRFVVAAGDTGTTAILQVDPDGVVKLIA